MLQWCLVTVALGLLLWLAFQSFLVFLSFFLLYVTASSDLKLQQLVANRQLWWQNLWQEIRFVNAKYLLWPLVYWQYYRRWRAVRKHAGKQVVVLVAGYLRNSTDWWWLQGQLQQALPALVIYPMQLSQRGQSIEQIAASLQQQLLRLRQRYGVEQVTLVGHSMGGLVSAYLAEQQAELVDAAAAPRVARVVLLGSPLHGTSVASLGQQATAVQMRCHSEFLQQLRELMSSGAPRYYYVLSRLDNMIFPWQSAELQAPSRAGTLILDCSHQGLLHHRLVCEMLVVWLLTFD